jgi:hypothetical protein
MQAILQAHVARTSTQPRNEEPVVRQSQTPNHAPLRRGRGRVLGIGLGGLCRGGRRSSSRGSGSLSLGGLCLSGFTVIAVGRGPEREVVTQQLHDQSAVAVRLLAKRVKLGNGIVERLLGEMACSVRRVEDLVIEDGEVQGEAETDGVSGSKLRLRNIGGALNRLAEATKSAGGPALYASWAAVAAPLRLSPEANSAK